MSWGKSILKGGHSKCKGPETEALASRLEWAKERGL